MYQDVVKTEYGYYTLRIMPSDEERERYYKELYYQESLSSYSNSYTDEERTFFNAKLEQKLLLIEQHIHLTEQSSVLDIGCGEGFAVNFFSDKGLNVLGLDYSKAGVEKQNPSIVDKVMYGDVYDSIDRLIAQNRRFDVVNMDNILEHVVDPKHLLEMSKALLKAKGVLVVKVPNDFSKLQQWLFENHRISKPHWVVPLEHISYFNREGLVNLCKSSGLTEVDIIGNYFTEFSALNENTNYLENPAVGKSCHFARVAMENLFHEISPIKTIELYRTLGAMGLGREIIGIFTVEE